MDPHNRGHTPFDRNFRHWFGIAVAFDRRADYPNRESDPSTLPPTLRAIFLMHDRIEKLLAWQDQERRLFNLKKTITDIPAEVEAVKQRLASFVAAEEAAREAVKTSEKTIHRIQMEIDSLRDKIGQTNAKSNDIRDNELYRKLMQTVEEFRQRISDQETLELEEMERLDALKAELAAKKAATEEAKKQVAGEVQDLKTRAENALKQLKSVEGARDESAAAVDPENLRLAQRIVARSVPGKTFNPALVQIHNGNCGGCHMKLTSNALNNAKKGTGVCDTCGAMVYPEG